MTTQKPPVAVVTGAGSGIGRALAQQLDAEGHALTLCDINEAGLAETAALLRRPPHLEALDVSRRPDVEAMAHAVLARHGQVDLVINNAGVSVAATVAELDYDDFEWLFGINFWGVVYGTKAFLPAMLARGQGTVVNVSSIFGIVGFPRQAAYNAAKFAVRGFTEALWQELEGTGVTAVSVHPGGIRTNIARAARVPRGEAAKRAMVLGFDRSARTSPEEAARVILRGARAKQRRVLVGADAHLMQLAQRLLPGGYPRLFRAVGKALR